VSWGEWAGEGMAGEAMRAYLARRGLRAMDPALALAALEVALGSGEAHVLVVDIEWETFRESFEAWGPRPLLSEVGRSSKAKAPEEAGHLLRDTLLGLEPTEQAEHLREWLQREFAAALGHTDAKSLDPHRGFFDLGMDSLTVVELRRRLQLALGLPVPASVIFNHPNLVALTTFLLTKLQPTQDSPPPSEVQASSAPTDATLSVDDLVKLIDLEFKAISK
jgi:hypothetical protein